MTYLPDLLPSFKRHFLQFRHKIGQFRNSCDVFFQEWHWMWGTLHLKVYWHVGLLPHVSHLANVHLTSIMRVHVTDTISSLLYHQLNWRNSEEVTAICRVSSCFYLLRFPVSWRNSCQDLAWTIYSSKGHLSSDIGMNFKKNSIWVFSLQKCIQISGDNCP